MLYCYFNSSPYDSIKDRASFLLKLCNNNETPFGVDLNGSNVVPIKSTFYRNRKEKAIIFSGYQLQTDLQTLQMSFWFNHIKYFLNRLKLLSVHSFKPFCKIIFTLLFFDRRQQQ